jgi:hypothetical protein
VPTTRAAARRSSFLGVVGSRPGGKDLRGPLPHAAQRRFSTICSVAWRDTGHRRRPSLVAARRGVTGLEGAIGLWCSSTLRANVPAAGGLSGARPPKRGGEPSGRHAGVGRECPHALPGNWWPVGLQSQEVAGLPPNRRCAAGTPAMRLSALRHSRLLCPQRYLHSRARAVLDALFGLGSQPRKRDVHVPRYWPVPG